MNYKLVNRIFWLVVYIGIVVIAVTVMVKELASLKSCLMATAAYGLLSYLLCKAIEHIND